MKKSSLLAVLMLAASFTQAQTANSSSSGLPRDKNKTETKVHQPKVGTSSQKAHHDVTVPNTNANASSQAALLRAERSSGQTAAHSLAQKPVKVAPLKEPTSSHRSETNFKYQPPKQNNVQPSRISNRPQQQMTTPHR